MKKTLFILAGFLLLLGGCGEKRVVLRVIDWASGQEEVIIREQVALFEKAHPDIKVELETVNWHRMRDKLMIATAGGRTLDITRISSEWFAPLADKGVLVPLDEYVEEKGFDIDDFYHNALRDCRYKGKLYGIPVSVDPYAMYYNKKMFDEAGVPYPDETWDFDKYIEMCGKLTRDKDGDGRLDQWGTDVHADITPYLYGFGGQYVSDDHSRCALNSPEALKTFRLLTDLIYEYKVSPTADDTANLGNYKLFTQGKLATIVSGSWAADAIFSREGKAIGLDFDTAPVPKGPKGRYTKMITNSYGIMRYSEHRKEAWEFIKWMSGAECQIMSAERILFIPVRKSAAEDFLAVQRPPRNKQAFIDAIDCGMGSVQVSCWPEAENIISGSVEKMLLGKEPIEDIADDAVREVNKILAAEKR